MVRLHPFIHQVALTRKKVTRTGQAEQRSKTGTIDQRANVSLDRGAASRSGTTRLPSHRSRPHPAPRLRAAPSPCGTVLHCAHADAPRASGVSSSFRRAGCSGLRVTGLRPNGFPQGSSGLRGATGSFRWRKLGVATLRSRSAGSSPTRCGSVSWPRPRE